MYDSFEKPYEPKTARVLVWVEVLTIDCLSFVCCLVRLVGWLVGWLVVVLVMKHFCSRLGLSSCGGLRLLRRVRRWPRRAFGRFAGL